MSKRIHDLIISYPAKPRVRQALLSLIFEFVELEKQGINSFMRKRDALNLLLKPLSVVGGETASLVQGTIFVLKRIRPELMPDDRDGHYVTDHAFCAAVRRLGHDMAGLKDKAHAEAIEAGLRPVHADGLIVTFLPALKGAADVQA